MLDRVDAHKARHYMAGGTGRNKNILKLFLILVLPLATSRRPIALQPRPSSLRGDA